MVTPLVATRRLTVCVLSPHPMVLEEFQRQLSHPGFRALIQRLDSTGALDLRRLDVPRAPVYVVDALAQRPATEALVAGILERFPAARLLVVGESFGEPYAFALLRLGVKGLLTYVEAREQLLRALPLVAGGGFWVSRSILSRFVDSILTSVSSRRLKGSTAAHLSRREKEVLNALLENLSNKEIASNLNISERTVKFHVSNLLAKFGVRRRADLILQCYQSGPSAT